MHCPACNNELSTLNVGRLEVDVCNQHCGGIWFDAGEFERYDEAHEDAPLAMLKAVKIQNVAIDRNKLRSCPRCENVNLKKCYFDSTHEIEIDQCGICGGIWLDPGELLTVRNENKGAVERKKVIEDFYASASSGQTDPKHQKGIKAVLGLLFR